MKNADYRALILVSTIIAEIIVDPHTGEHFPAKHQAMITEAEHDMINSKKIEKFIDKQKVSFICSIDNENYPNIRAMLKPRKRIGLKEFYFSTNTSSLKVKQYRENPNASIYFYHKCIIKYIGIMLKGTMEVLTDQETKNLLWQKGDKIFYKKGITDPDYCVLKFTATGGRYYSDLKTENFDVDNLIIRQL